MGCGLKYSVHMPAPCSPAATTACQARRHRLNIARASASAARAPANTLSPNPAPLGRALKASELNPPPPCTAAQSAWSPRPGRCENPAGRPAGPTAAATRPVRPGGRLRADGSVPPGWVAGLRLALAARAVRLPRRARPRWPAVPGPDAPVPAAAAAAPRRHCGGPSR